MKKILLPLAFVSFFLGACTAEDSTGAESTESNSESSEEVMTEDEGAPESSAEEVMEEDLLLSIVQKGGVKSEDQIAIESMMAEIDETNTGKDQEMIGHWVGKFGKNMINLTITKVEGDYIEGFSICAGNFRKIVGSYTLDGATFANVKMDEPGTDQYDGSFEFVIDFNQDEVSGHWTPFEAKGNSEKDFLLVKRNYTYDPTVGDYDGSSGVLSDDFLMEVDEWTLGYVRNEIYARHGYSFKNKEWRYEFEGMDWYMPMGVDIRDQLTNIEVKNIGLIYEYESYYEDYYDEYGR